MLPKVLKNFNLFIDGRGYAGRIEEITLPKLVNRTEEFRLGGLDMPVHVDVGLEKLECDFTLSEYDVELIKLFGIEDNSSTPMPLRGTGLEALIGGNSSSLIPFTLRGGLCNEESKVVPVAVFIEGSVIELDLGQWKAGENATLKVRLGLRYYRLEVDQQTLIEIDADNRVRRVDGNNQISTSPTDRRARTRRRENA